jgi:hypothetical protein
MFIWLLEKLSKGDFVDNDLRDAISFIKVELCTGKYAPKGIYIASEKRVVMDKCLMDSEIISSILLTYIACFSLSEHESVRYYYDEWSDRLDAYREGLLKSLTSGVNVHNSSITSEQVNDVLSSLYWGVKNGHLSVHLLCPKGVSKFKSSRWYIKEPFNTIFSITESVYNSIVKVLQILVKGVEVVIAGIDTVLDLTGGVLKGTLCIVKNLPYILTGGVLLFSGVQIYGKRKNGRFYGEDTARRVIRSKTGVGDGRCRINNNRR